MTTAELLTLALLAFVGLVAGWINTVAGAGSLLLLPALIFAGLPADAANATNRISVLVQSLFAVWGYRRAGFVVGPSERVFTVAAAIGGVLGALIATFMSAGQVRDAIVIAMGVMLVLSLIPRTKGSQAKTLPAPTPATMAGLFVIGIYGGFLQAGVGILVLLFLSLALGAGLVASNVLKSTVTLVLSIVSLAVFASRGETIDPIRGGALALGSALGGYLGARATVKLGEKWIRGAIVIAVACSMIKLLWDR